MRRKSRAAQRTDAGIYESGDGEVVRLVELLQVRLCSYVGELAGSYYIARTNYI